MPSQRGNVRTARVHDAPDPDDGWRVLVDRLWPRGVSRQAAHVDEWLKEIAPSAELRTWYHEDPANRYDEFVHRYRAELQQPGRQQIVQQLRARAETGPITLVTAVRAVAHSHIPVLLEAL